MGILNELAALKSDIKNSTDVVLESTTLDSFKFFEIFKSMIDADGYITTSLLNKLKSEINRFYKGNSMCDDVLYTKNVNQFFGMCVYPEVSSSDACKNIMSVDDSNRHNYPYMLELDSRLFDPLLGLNEREMTAVLLHEIGHIVIYEQKNRREISNFVNSYLISKRKTISMDQVSSSRELFKYAYIRMLQAIGSIFYMGNEEFEADRFSIEYGLGHDLESAFDKIIRYRGTVDSKNKFIPMVWALNAFDAMKFRNRLISEITDDIENLSGSRLEKKAFVAFRTNIARNEKNILSESADAELLRQDIIQEMFNGMKRSGMKAIEDETFVYAIKLKNIQSPTEAYDLLHSINGKLNMVQDFLQNEKNISDVDLKRWQMLETKLLDLRDQLVKSDAYKPKYYGLFCQYPVTQRQY